MKKKIILISFIITILMGGKIVYGISHSVHSSHSIHSSHSTTHSTTSHSTTKSAGTVKSGKTITGYKSSTSSKTYTTPKTYTSKYNSSNIKTQTVNSNPSHFSSYSSTNMFRPNFWTAMWAFNCMKDNGNDNSKEVTEQDIAKELEERGYSQDEIKEILKDGEKAKEETDKEDRKKTILGIAVIIIFFIIIVGGTILIGCL